MLQSFRLYRLDGAGKIVAADWIEAAAEEDALREARNRAADGRFELWEGRRLVGREGGVPG